MGTIPLLPCTESTTISSNEQEELPHGPVGNFPGTASKCRPSFPSLFPRRGPAFSSVARGIEGREPQDTPPADHGNMVMQVIAQDSSMTVEEASEMVADTRKAALADVSRQGTGLRPHLLAPPAAADARALSNAIEAVLRINSSWFSAPVADLCGRFTEQLFLLLVFIADRGGR